MLITSYFCQQWKLWLKDIFYLWAVKCNFNFAICHTNERYFTLGGTGNKNINQTFFPPIFCWKISIWKTRKFPRNVSNFSGKIFGLLVSFEGWVVINHNCSTRCIIWGHYTYNRARLGLRSCHVPRFSRLGDERWTTAMGYPTLKSVIVSAGFDGFCNFQ